MPIPAAIPHRKQEIRRTVTAVTPRLALYTTSWGLSRMELIINAPSHSSFMPPLEKEAAMGTVPYIQRGDAIPRALAAAIPAIPPRRPRFSAIISP